MDRTRNSREFILWVNNSTQAAKSHFSTTFFVNSACFKYYCVTVFLRSSARSRESRFTGVSAGACNDLGGRGKPARVQIWELSGGRSRAGFGRCGCEDVSDSDFQCVKGKLGLMDGCVLPPLRSRGESTSNRRDEDMLLGRISCLRCY